MNATEKYGAKLFIHGGKEPFVRLTVNPRKNTEETLQFLEILAENRKTGTAV